MRKLTLFFALNILFTAASFADVAFINGDIKAAKQKAAREGKLIFLDFWASYCTPCRMMEEYTFTDPSVSNYIREHYVPVKVDIQTFDGYDLKNQYNVSLLPTIVVLNSKGVQVGRHEETFTASKFVSILKNYNQPKNRIRITSNSGEGYNNTTGYSNTSTGRINTSSVATTGNNSVAAERAIDRTPKVRSSAHLPVENAQPTKASANTFTVQVGAFASENQLKSVVDGIKTKYRGTQKVFVSRKKENGKMMYRVLLGQFSTRQQAVSFTHSNKVKGFVRSLDKI